MLSKDFIGNPESQERTTGKNPKAEQKTEYLLQTAHTELTAEAYTPKIYSLMTPNTATQTAHF